jgi:hypothetical protein
MNNKPFTNARVVSVNTEPSVYHNNQFQRGDPKFVMSRSELRIFARCPHKWIAGFREDESDSKEWGSLCDLLLLQPHLVKDKIAVPPECYRNDKGEDKDWNNNAKVCREWNQAREDEGRMIVKTAKFNDAQSAIGILMEDPINAEVVEFSQHQVYCTADYTDDKTGIVVPVKILIDLAPDKDHVKLGKTLVDFKTCADGSHKSWSREVQKWGYCDQAAIYLDVYRAATGEDRVEFRHLLQESEQPFEVGRRTMYDDPDDLASFIALGRTAYQSALAHYCLCLDTGDWHGYDTHGPIDGWTPVQPEMWMLKG